MQNRHDARSAEPCKKITPTLPHCLEGVAKHVRDKMLTFEGGLGVSPTITSSPPQSTLSPRVCCGPRVLMLWCSEAWEKQARICNPANPCSRAVEHRALCYLLLPPPVTLFLLPSLVLPPCVTGPLLPFGVLPPVTLFLLPSVPFGAGDALNTSRSRFIFHPLKAAFWVQPLLPPRARTSSGSGCSP
jgi:hypothetical protein